MSKTKTPAFAPGQRITYNDGRPGHTDAQATVVSVTEDSMIVQFDDRADGTFISFSDAEWMPFISVIM